MTEELVNEEEKSLPQARAQFDPYTIITKQVDDDTLMTIDAWNKETWVDYYHDMDEKPQNGVGFIDHDGKHKIALVSDLSPQVNGVRWNIVPGKNKIPKSLYESMMNTLAIAEAMRPKTGITISQISR